MSFVDENVTESPEVPRGNEPHPNLDPITGAPGAHPLGVVGGAVGAGVFGSAVGGAIGGPVGAVVGAAVGAVAGGIVGKSVAEELHPTLGHEYWKANYKARPYVRDEDYEAFEPAFQYGWESYRAYRDSRRSFDDIEPLLAAGWPQHRGYSKLDWPAARPAVRDAWERMSEFETGEKLLGQM